MIQGLSLPLFVTATICLLLSFFFVLLYHRLTSLTLVFQIGLQWLRLCLPRYLAGISIWRFTNTPHRSRKFDAKGRAQMVISVRIRCGQF
jgi:hypothetical protein